MISDMNNNPQSQTNYNIFILKEALKTAQQSNISAININLTLHEHSEKMIGIDKKLNKINYTLDKSQDTAKEITSFWYYLKNKVKRVLGIKKSIQIQEEKEGNSNTLDLKPQQSKESNSNKLAQVRSAIDQEDELAEELINKIKEMKSHSKVMGKELDKQNELLTKIDGKMDRANNKTENVNKILKKVL